MAALFLLTPILILPAMLLLERFERYALRGGRGRHAAAHMPRHHG